MESVHAADTEYLVRKGMSTGYRLLSLATPPLYVALVITRRGRTSLTMNNLLRATWIGGAAGTVGGGTFEYVRSAFSNEEVVRTRRFSQAYNTAAIRAEDHSTVGGLLFALLTPAIFWNKARIVHLLLGGAGFGSAIGSCVHYGRTLSGDPPPQIAVPPMPTAALPEI